jgi:hypothetical protein
MISKRDILVIFASAALIIVGTLYWFKSQPDYRDNKKRISL